MTSPDSYPQEESNLSGWRRGTHLGDYDSRVLRPVEAVILARFHAPLSGRVLEIGCGGGRLLGYLATLAQAAHGIDVSEAMVEHCRRRYPAAHVQIGDLRDLSRFAEGSLDAVWASYNVLDVVDDHHRRTALADMHRRLTADGLLIFSSHNLQIAPGPPSPSVSRAAQLGRLLPRLLSTPPSSWLTFARRRLRQIRNRRRLSRYEQRTPDYAILNDSALDYGALHYHITRERQQRQLAEIGFQLLECLDLEGERIAAGAVSSSPELHYIAVASSP